MTNNIKDPALKKPTPAQYGEPGGGSSLQIFFTDALKNIYWAEQELVKALPSLITAATTLELATAIEKHLVETEMHVQRLEEIFQLLNKPADATVCFAMEGLIKEAASIKEKTDEGSIIRDAAIIMTAQKIEHYEISTYGSLVEYAKTLGYNVIRGILQLTLDEERMTDSGLTLIAQNKINWEADMEDADAEDIIKDEIDDTEEE